MPKPRKTNRTRPAPRTAFKKGHKKVGGRQKGTPNRFSGELKQHVLNALANAHADGPEAYLKQQAKNNSRSFLQLVAKLLPTQLTGKDGNPLEVALIAKAQAGLSNLSTVELDQFQKLLTKIGIGVIPQ